jgi:DnaK suppressor protein
MLPRMRSLDFYRQRLLDLKAELLREGDVAIEPSRKDETAVGSDEDEQALVEMNQVIASKRNLARTLELAKINAALKRLENAPDDFGLCVECGEEIGKRLEARPYVEYCVECQAERDGARSKGPRRHAGDFR